MASFTVWGSVLVGAAFGVSGCSPAPAGLADGADAAVVPATSTLSLSCILVRNWGIAGAALAMGLSNLRAVAYVAIWLQRPSEHCEPRGAAVHALFHHIE